MAEQRTKFLEGAKENDIPEQTANYLFDLIEKFAGYGFNKSHSAAYALISYQTAYLKAHYPHEFMASLITSEVANTDKVISHINACREAGIQVLKPDINHSQRHFSVEGESIRFGLAGVKNVGEGAIKELVQERQANGPYQSLLDLCQRNNLRKLSKRVLESLIKSGAMDCLGCSRAGLTAGLDRIVAAAQKKHKEKNSGQLSLMSMVAEESPPGLQAASGLGMDLPEAEIEEWSDEERLRNEKETLGFFLSGHPLLRYREAMRLLKTHTLKDCKDLAQETEVRVALLVTGCKEITTKKGKRMAFCQAEDLTGTAELVLFPETYGEIKNHLDSDQPLLCTAKIGADQNQDSGGESAPSQLKLVAEGMQLLSQTQIPESEPYVLRVRTGDMHPDKWSELMTILGRYPGNNPVQLIMDLDEAECRLQLGHEYSVMPEQKLGQELSDWQNGTSVPCR
jgi:DNA polymerase-3 subunit alpha